jgi:protein-tyrosine phosphatase
MDTNIKSVLMVCLGNICRSPMAEGILRNKLKEANLKVFVDSAGTSPLHKGEAPDRRAIKCLGTYGIDISELRARPFSSKDFADFDRIFAMDSDNYQNILRMAVDEDQSKKVSLFMESSMPGESVSVRDPWYGDEKGFHEVYKMIDSNCDSIVEKLWTAKN